MADGNWHVIGCRVSGGGRAEVPSTMSIRSPTSPPAKTSVSSSTRKVDPPVTRITQCSTACRTKEVVVVVVMMGGHDGEEGMKRLGWFC